MALQVWFPLTGNLENKGLCNITATNSGATVNSAGKIGKCYSFDKTLLQRLNLSGITDLVDIVKEHDFSVCAWLKTTENGCWLSITYSYRFWSNMIYVPYNNFTSLGSKVIDGKWHHLCYTHSHTTLKNSCYIDGLEVYSNVGTAAATTTYKNAARIGNDVNNSSAVNNHFNGDINDVRIYDHCLSAKEVHEIAQGLVLHLPLNGQYNTRLPAGYKELEYIESSGASYFGTGVKFNPEVDSCTVVFKGNDTTNNGMILASTGTKPYWWLYYYYNGSSIRVYADNGSGQQNILGASNDTNKHTAVYKSKHLYMDGVDKGYLSNTYAQTATNLSMFSYGGGGYMFKGRIYYVDIQRDGQCVRMFIPAQRNSDSVAGMYDIVTGTFYTSASSTAFVAGPVTVASASVCDCSGYGHHGTINGSLIAASGSPRYDQTINITCPGYGVSGATYNYIYCPLTLTPTVYTVTFWFKGSSRYSGGVVCTSANTAFTDYTTTLIHDYDASIRCTIGGSNKSLNTSNWIIDGTWHHYAITYDGTNLIMYKDGTSVQTVAATGTLPTINYIALNYSCAGGVKRGVNNAGYSDYRFYTTVLSATDIRELYDTAASIDNLGEVHSYQFVEETVNKEQILQTGQFKANEMIEKINYLYLPVGSCVVSTGPSYTAGDVCRAITILRYETGGSGARDLMGFSAGAACYWGVTAAGAWEKANSYTDSDITKLNTIVYNYTVPSGNSGTYSVGCIGATTSWAARAKFIYDVKLYKNGILERHLIPAKTATGVGLYDTVGETFYPTNTGGSISSDSTTAKMYTDYIETSQLLEK